MPGDTEPPATATPPPRDEMAAAPPFLTWRAIYAIVLGALVVEIIGFALLTAALR